MAWHIQCILLNPTNSLAEPWETRGLQPLPAKDFNLFPLGWKYHLKQQPRLLCLPEDFLLGWAKQTVSFDLSRLGQKVCFKPDRQGKLYLNMLADQGEPQLPCPVLSPLTCLKLLKQIFDTPTPPYHHPDKAMKTSISAPPLTHAHRAWQSWFWFKDTF